MIYLLKAKRVVSQKMHFLFHILEHYGPLPKGCFFKTLLSPFDTFVYLVISKWIMYLQVWAQISQELQRGPHSRVKFEKSLQFGESMLKTKSNFSKDQRSKVTILKNLDFCQTHLDIALFFTFLAHSIFPPLLVCCWFWGYHVKIKPL